MRCRIACYNVRSTLLKQYQAAEKPCASGCEASADRATDTAISVVSSHTGSSDLGSESDVRRERYDHGWRFPSTDAPAGGRAGGADLEVRHRSRDGYSLLEIMRPPRAPIVSPPRTVALIQSWTAERDQFSREDGMRCTFAGITIATVVSAGCAYPHAATVENFRRVFDEYHAQVRPCRGLDAMDVGTRDSTPCRLREDLRTTRRDTERTATTLVLTNQENRTFHVISQRLTKLFFSFFQAGLFRSRDLSTLHGIARISHPGGPYSLAAPAAGCTGPRGITTRHAEAETDRRVPTRVPARSASRPDPDRLWCTSFAGFGVRVSPGGRKTFMVRYRLGGRYRRVKLGVYPEFVARRCAAAGPAGGRRNCGRPTFAAGTSARSSRRSPSGRSRRTRTTTGNQGRMGGIQ